MMHPPMPPYYQPQPAAWGQQPAQMAAPQQLLYGQSQGGQQSAAPGEIRSLWIGDLQYWMDENYLYDCFANTGEVKNVKIIKNKQTGHSEGYGFVEFNSRAAAERVLQTYTGQTMPNVSQVYRLNWASSGSGERRNDNNGDEHTIFVGDLGAEVTDSILEETFKAHYQSVKGAKVVMDKLTGRSKGYGFVKFEDPTEQQRAMTEMNGEYCSTRQMRIGPAANKKAFSSQQYSNNGYQGTQESDNDPNNTTIFVGGIDGSSVTEESLRQVFGPYGEIVYVKIPVGKRCAFVQFSSRPSAEAALSALNGTTVAGQSIRLSWGRSPSNKQQQQQDSNQWNAGYYGYGQGYENFGYAQPQQNANMFAYGGYPGYGNYQQQAQQQPQQQ
ncbi:Polyadenylate-binding protein RBP45 [Rhynchospora pubera]|uniref:Polyadenylate-binding protein RBP45 n=1 Tax=Rhynchospora pubera TaxID=906938 RepID=A0AAV8D2Y5_9POAL|nr:Polyadenylate-binding protein RBP45 [Rhynchospora pubera]